MSAEKIFCGGRGAFLFVFWALFMVLYGVSGAVWWCSCVTFYVGMRDV
jgi:hypothetical protein